MQIHELHLFTHDLDRQRDFYTRILELPLSLSSDGQFALTVGTSRLVFASTTQAQPLSYHFAFNIPEHQFVEAKQWLTARIALLTEPGGANEFHFPSWQAHSIYFLDPDGNILEFIARHNLPHAQTQPFTSAHLLCISEIGLVVDQVPDFVRHFEAQTGIPAYGDSSGEMFRSVGDEKGLLVVVRRERLWMPDMRVAAREAPLEVRFSENDGTAFWLAGPPYNFRPA